MCLPQTGTFFFLTTGNGSLEIFRYEDLLRGQAQSLKTLQAAFANEGLNYEEVLARIKDLVIKAVISVEPLLANNLNRASRNRHLCFEVFGFDVILD